jgi:hypothetical protein
MIDLPVLMTSFGAKEVAEEVRRRDVASNVSPVVSYLAL